MVDRKVVRLEILGSAKVESWVGDLVVKLVVVRALKMAAYSVALKASRMVVPWDW